MGSMEKLKKLDYNLMFAFAIYDHKYVQLLASFPLNSDRNIFVI